MAESSGLQNSLLQAIDYLVNNRIDKISRDVTITATIKKANNSLTGEYQVNYNGGFLMAYAQEGASYSENENVYVLVPEGDFSKKKLIIGQASKVTEDNNITVVSSLMSDYNMIGRNTIEDTNNVLPSGLHSYLASDYVLLYQHGDEEHSLLAFNESEFSNYIKDAEALLVEASFMTRLPKAHRLAKNGKYGIQYVLAFKNQDQPQEIKYVSYTLDSNNMTGNPFLYNSYTDQYAIFPIDAENYLYVDSIMVWSEGFVEKDDTVQADFWGADILVKEPEIYGLRKISATNGDYMLRLSTPQGALFTSFEKTDTLTARGTVTYQVNTDISSSTSYYWFAKDDRVNVSSEAYNIYGGSGWRYLKDKGNNRQMETTGYENRAYENIYEIVAVYKEQIILKQEFTLYNEAASRAITIESDLGTRFSFDRGKPTLTCLIDGNNGVSADFDSRYPNSYFTFSWSKIDEVGGTTPLNTTYDELQKQYDDAVASGSFDYSTLAAIKNSMIAMQGVEFDKNVLKYPVSQIAANATFSCSVFLKETEDGESLFIGSAKINLQNESVASPTDYYILIENGDQVFQYSESGVSPASERYQDPQDILPLECHFFDPAGLEVNSDTYSVKWKVPLSGTMIVTPSKGMIVNPATSLEEWYTQAVFPLDIDANYDYQATTNQVTCIVTYNGTEYQKDSDLFFTKVGENGTNGTDVVCKISPKKAPAKGLFALKTVGGKDPQWNTGEGIGVAPLSFSVYNQAKLIETPSVSWTISGGSASQSRYFSIDRSLGTIDWADSGQGHRNQIIRGSISLEGQTYYAFYPIPQIDYSEGTSYEVVIDKTWTLKNITYNADGRNPLYDKNQGLFFSLSDKTENKYVVFDVVGGADDSQDAAAISLSFEKNSSNTYKSVEGGTVNEDGLYYVYITPDDVYDGAWCNNIVRARIYGSKNETDKNPEATIYMPIYMSLNTFGLSSLNAWDGNHVEINEDENYILAPQIGAGVKDKNNRFTGVVMGTAQTYDQSDPSIGLLGYSAGKQSIFLDAETGNAMFGLPENQASANNKYTEGRIELVPGGNSKIGMWTVGSRAIYNMTKPPVPKTDSSGNPEEDKEGDIEFTDDYIGVEPDAPYTDYPVPDAQISVPPEAQGIILNANPAYMSVKGMPLTDKNSNIEWTGANTNLVQGDSIEVELDPRKSSVFSIYRHTTRTKENDDGTETTEWYRYPMVGINANGQFYTNAIKDGESSMGIGRIGAFGTTAAANKWIGAQFAYKGTNIFKFFIPNDDSQNAATRPVYITAGSTTSTEYPRDVGIYGKTISLYSNSTNSTDETSPHWLKISNDIASLGHTNNYIQIPSAAGSEDNNFEISTQANAEISFTGKKTTISNAKDMVFSTKTFTGTVDSGSFQDKAITLDVVGDVSVNGFRNLTIANSDDDNTDKNLSITIDTAAKTTAGGVETTTPQIKLGGKNTVLELNNSSTNLWSTQNNDIKIDSTNGGIIIQTNKDGNGIKLDARWGGDNVGHPYLHLTPQSDGTGDFYLSSGHGSVKSLGNLGNNRQGVQITPGFSTGWAYFTGTPDQNSTISIQAERDIYSANGWMYGGNFVFNADHSWNSHNVTYNSRSIEQHLAWLYSLVNDAYYRADAAYDQAGAAYNRADAAYNRAQNYFDSHIGSYATRSWVDDNYVSGHASDFVLASKFNQHNHTFKYSTKKINDGDSAVYIINGTSGGIRVFTSTPN